MHEMFDRILSLRISNVMTADPLTVELSDSMTAVSQLFAKHNLHAAPVNNELGQCVGIISTSDFVKRCESLSDADADEHRVFQDEEGIRVEPRSYDRVAECMSQGVQCVSRSTPLITAAKIMTQSHIHVLPVVESHQAVGVVSNLDVVAALVNAFEEAKNSLIS